LLFVGPQDAKQLRDSLRAFGVRQSSQSFHGMMMRLMMANYVEIRQHQYKTSVQTVRCHRFEITDLGLHTWLEAWRFYQGLCPPSAELTPATTDEGRLAAYDPKTRKAVAGREKTKDANEMARALHDIVLGMAGK
jgi:hypothetical protein